MWESGAIVPPFLTSALDASDWSASRPFCFNPGKTARGIHCIEGWVDLRSGLNAMEKRKVFADKQHPPLGRPTHSLVAISAVFVMVFTVKSPL
jgi:hypothetical protein